VVKRKRIRKKSSLIRTLKERFKAIALILKSFFKVSVVIFVFGVIAAGFLYLGNYVRSGPERSGFLVLMDVPAWVNEALKEKVYNAATAGGEDLRLDENAAQTVQQNIESMVVWLDDVKVRTSHKSIEIKGWWRKPLALVKEGLREPFYVDADLVVLDFVPMANLPIVNVKGLSVVSRTAVAGEMLYREDLAAAVAVLDRLERMDKLVSGEKPLLFEIDRIDVSNFNGREDGRLSHIILYTKDNTEIIWGAEIGKWQRYMEASDEEKLGKLYSYYNESGSLLGAAEYINLRYPEGKIPQPIDKY